MNCGFEKSTFVDRHQLTSGERQQRIEQVLSQAAEQQIETIRVSFVDQHGILRGKVIVVDELQAAFSNGLGITSTLLLKDTSHTTVFPVWQEDAGFGKGTMIGAADLIMLPDPRTFRVLPWASGSAAVLSDLYDSDGNALTLSSRQLLQNAIDRLATQNMAFVCGLEIEFYVYRLEQPNLQHHHTGRPGTPPSTSLLAQGYQYLTEQHFDQLEPVMELIRRNALALALPVRSLEAEFGPSQFEITFQPMAPLAAADSMAIFRNMVKQVCRREGYHATFMSRPNLDNAMGSGWHLHQSVVSLEGGDSLLRPPEGKPLSDIGSQWIAGLLAHAEESCLLSTPTVNGYKRYQPYALAPDRIEWGIDNRGAMLRVLCDSTNDASRIENRVGESAANPHLYIASQILSGLDGVMSGAVAPPPVVTPYSADRPGLPNNLHDAIEAFANSAFYRRQLGDRFVDYLAHIKRAEWNRFIQTVSEWEQREYFSIF